MSVFLFSRVGYGLFGIAISGALLRLCSTPRTTTVQLRLAVLALHPDLIDSEHAVAHPIR